MKLDDRGFGSVEFLFVTLIVFIIIGGIVSLIGNELNQGQTTDLAEARVTGEKLAGTINTVYIKGNSVNGNKYYVNITIPDDFDFTATITKGNITVLSNNQNITIKIIPLNVSDFTMTSGHTYTVNNIDGTITFTQCN
ncbi:MAG TPA: hypothetical protein VGC02_01835 [Methanobacterium sp.]